MNLYIDPGTGSMLFTILIGILGTAGYLLRNVFVKLRFLFNGGAREKDTSGDRIPYAVFSDHKRYWSTFESICDEFERRGEPLVFMTASPDDPALSKHYEHVKCSFIGEGNHAFAKLNFLKADILLATTPGLDVYQWKRSRDVKWYAHVLHMANDPTTYRMFGLDYYDALLLCGEYQAEQQRKLEEKRHLPAKEIVLTGLPYLDQLKKRLDTAEPLPEHPVTILLAPSWGKSSLFGRYEGRIIEAALATGYHVVVRPHPQSFTAEKELMERLMQKYADTPVEWNRDNDNFDVLKSADIMISDFSGVIFDFSLVFDKPFLYAESEMDKSPYDCAWIEKELWVYEVLPKIGTKLKEEDFSDLKAVIDDCIENPKGKENRDQARSETWVKIGEGSKNVADYLVRKLGELDSDKSDDADKTKIHK